jgi:hypothetical protein
LVQKRCLDIAVRQAALASSNSDVILLTDVERPGLSEIRQFAPTAHGSAVTEFEPLYRHISVNDSATNVFASHVGSMSAIWSLSDMNALLDLAGDNPMFCNQSALPAKGFDDNMLSSLNGFFAMKGAIKSLRLDADGIPLAKRNSDGADVPFHFLHFQGRAKDLMANFAWSVTESSGHHSLRIHMEDIDTRTEIETETAMLRRRIAALEHDVPNLREMVTALLRRSWRAKCTPSLPVGTLRALRGARRCRCRHLHRESR